MSLEPKSKSGFSSAASISSSFPGNVVDLEKKSPINNIYKNDLRR